MSGCHGADHPDPSAIIAQAAATAGAMLPGRFFLGVGTGENLNEHVLGARWPAWDIRTEMLVEAISGGPAPAVHLAAIRPHLEAGYDHVYLHQVGPEQEGFLDFVATTRLPGLRDLARPEAKARGGRERAGTRP